MLCSICYIFLKFSPYIFPCFPNPTHYSQAPQIYITILLLLTTTDFTTKIMAKKLSSQNKESNFQNLILSFTKNCCCFNQINFFLIITES